MPKQNNERKEPNEVNKDTVYSELYSEMRRYRDYHLNVATWYTVILLAVFGEILTVKFGSVQPGLSQLLSTNLAVKILIAVFTTLIGISGC